MKCIAMSARKHSRNSPPPGYVFARGFQCPTCYYMYRLFVPESLPSGEQATYIAAGKKIASVQPHKNEHPDEFEVS